MSAASSREASAPAASAPPSTAPPSGPSPAAAESKTAGASATSAAASQAAGRSRFNLEATLALQAKMAAALPAPAPGAAAATPAAPSVAASLVALPMAAAAAAMAKDKPKPGPTKSSQKYKRRRDQVDFLSEAEERRLLEQMPMFKQLDKSAATNRYFAKLTLREKRRRAGIPQFNIDAWVTDSLNSMPKANQALSLYYPDFYKSAASKPAAPAAPAPLPPPPAAAHPTAPAAPQVAPHAAPAYTHPPPTPAHVPAVASPVPTQHALPHIPISPLLAALSSPTLKPATPSPATVAAAASAAAAAAAAANSTMDLDPPPLPPIASPSTITLPPPPPLAGATGPPPLSLPPPTLSKAEAAHVGVAREMSLHDPPPPPAASKVLSSSSAAAAAAAAAAASSLPSANAAAKVGPAPAAPKVQAASQAAPKPPPTVTAKPPPLPMAVSESPRAGRPDDDSAGAAPHRSLFRGILTGDECARQLLQPFVSKYTLRTLKPFIRRDFESVPPQLAVLQELRKAFRERHLTDDEVTAPEDSDSIDYCYLRPQYLPAVNALLRHEFWPDIDVGEWVDLPELSVVVLYRRLVIGCGFISSEGYISYVAVHPQWRSSGIARFMIYHLIMACPNKDITLHVSANNSAMILYQRFGFKPEGFIRHFYDKYLPPDSTLCRHAFLLRLRR